MSNFLIKICTCPKFSAQTAQRRSQSAQNCPHSARRSREAATRRADKAAVLWTPTEKETKWKILAMIAI